MKDLLRTARLNSVLLAISFGLNTVTAAAGGSILFTVLGVLATGLTIRDVITFNNAIKEN